MRGKVEQITRCQACRRQISPVWVQAVQGCEAEAAVICGKKCARLLSSARQLVQKGKRLASLRGLEQQLAELEREIDRLEQRRGVGPSGRHQDPELDEDEELDLWQQDRERIILSEP